MSDNTSIKEDLVDCLTKQLSEIELLTSMYPNPGEIMISDSNIVEISNFINSESEYVPSNLDFVIKLTLNEIKVEVCVNLPLSYPSEDPDIYIRCNQLNRQQETQINAGLLEFIRNSHTGEVCVYTAINWLQDNLESFVTSKDGEILKPERVENNDVMFCRMWIYSHHIYSKKKREEIVKQAKEFDLTGFCLPGKPGVVCIEGTDHHCKQWWKIVKSMCWQKIAIRKTEIYEYSEKLKRRKFNDFKELHFPNPTNTKQTVMYSFSKFMIEHGFGQVFNELFGFDKNDDMESK